MEVGVSCCGAAMGEEDAEQQGKQTRPQRDMVTLSLTSNWQMG